MRVRRIPPPDIFADCPSHGPILPFYRGHFEAVYVMLHPFERALVAHFDPPNCVVRADLLRNAEAARWSEVQRIGGFASLAEMDVGLRTASGGLRQGFANEGLAARLRALESDGIFLPSEGFLSPLLENGLFGALESLGYECVWIGNEEGTRRTLEWFDDLRELEKVDSSSKRYFTPDKSLLIATHWDSHCSFLCSTHMNIERIIATTALEGFFCTPRTEVYWSLADSA